MELQELIIRFGLKVDDKALSNLNKIEAGFKGITDVASSIGKQFTGGKGIWDLFRGATGEIQQFKKIAAATGMSETSLKKWSDASKAAGADASEVLGDLRSLHTQFGYSEKSVMRLVKSFSKMSRESRKFWIENYGLSDSFAMLAENIDKTSDAYNKSKGFTQEEIEQSNKVETAINTLQNTFNNLTKSVVLEAAPGIAKFTEKLQKLVDAHPEGVLNLIKGALIGLTGVAVISGINNLIGSFANLAVGVGILKGAFDMLMKNKLVFLLVTGAFALNELWTAGKNVYHWATGDGEHEDSWIDQTVDSFFDMGKSASEYSDDIKKFMEETKELFSDFNKDVKKEITSTPKIINNGVRAPFSETYQPPFKGASFSGTPSITFDGANITVLNAGSGNGLDLFGEGLIEGMNDYITNTPSVMNMGKQ